MELYFGPVFQEFIEHRAVLTEALLERAVGKGILTPCGAEFLRNLR